MYIDLERSLRGLRQCWAHIWWIPHALRWSCLHHSRADAIPNPVSFIIVFIRSPSGLLVSKLLAGNSTNVISKCIDIYIDQSMYGLFIVNKFHWNSYKNGSLLLFSFWRRHTQRNRSPVAGTQQIFPFYKNSNHIKYLQFVCLFHLQLWVCVYGWMMDGWLMCGWMNDVWMDGWM